MVVARRGRRLTARKNERVRENEKERKREKGGKKKEAAAGEKGAPIYTTAKGVRGLVFGVYTADMYTDMAGTSTIRMYVHIHSCRCGGSCVYTRTRARHT